MSVLLETSLGDIVIDLNTSQCPQACLNFLKLCKIHYYSFNPFWSVKRGFLAQTGDPYGTGEGGQSVWSMLPSTSRDFTPAKYFEPERPRGLKHAVRGTVSLALSASESSSKAQIPSDDVPLVGGSQFFITLADDIEYLDGKHAPFGTVVEGQEVDGTLDKIEKAFVDDEDRPLRDIRIRHCIVLDDPFPDPDGLRIPSRTPSPTPSMLATARLDATASASSPEPSDDEAKEAARRKTDTAAAALTLELVGDLPFAEVRPPENILFVCKLNPVTRSEDLELIFSRFGKILSCEVIKDKKTGDSLQYAFIEFDEQASAEQAYLKMQNVLVDDRRIWVDFSQSVSKLHGDWVQKRTGGRGGRGSSSTGGRGRRNSSGHDGRSEQRQSSYGRGPTRDSRPDDRGSRYSQDAPGRDNGRDRDRTSRGGGGWSDRRYDSHNNDRRYERSGDHSRRDQHSRRDGGRDYRRSDDHRRPDEDRRRDRERSPRYR